MSDQTVVKHKPSGVKVGLLVVGLLVAYFLCTFAAASAALAIYMSPKSPLASPPGVAKGGGKVNGAPRDETGEESRRGTGKGAVGETSTLWEPGTTSSISASRVGKALAVVTTLDATRRRLREHAGRMLVEVAEVAAYACNDLIVAALDTGDMSGSAVLTSITGNTYVTEGSVSSYQIGTTAFESVVVSSSTGVSYTIEQESSTSNCIASEAVDGRRVRELKLTKDEHLILGNRRRLEKHVAGHGGAPPGATRPDEVIFLSEEDCLVYHCFEGDENCPDPAPAHACLSQGEAGCKQPMCKWLRGDSVVGEGKFDLSKVDFAAGALSAHLHINHVRRLGDNIDTCETNDDCPLNDNGFQGMCQKSSYRRRGGSYPGYCTDGSVADICKGSQNCNPAWETANGDELICYTADEDNKILDDDSDVSYQTCSSASNVCFARDTHVCFVSARHSGNASDAHAQCFGTNAAASAWLLPMAELVAGDRVLTADASGPAVTHVIVNFHRADTRDAPHLTLHFAGGSITLTPGHMLPLDGRVRPAAEAAVGSYLNTGNSTIQLTGVTHGRGGIINAHTASGTILAADPGSDTPVLASVFASEWASTVLHRRLLRIDALFGARLPAGSVAYMRGLLQGFVDSPAYTILAPLSFIRHNLLETIVSLLALLTAALVARRVSKAK